MALEEELKNLEVRKEKVHGREREARQHAAGKLSDAALQAALDRLNALGTDIRRTDQDGTVTVRVRNGAVGVF